MDKFMLIILAVVIVLIIRQLIPKKVDGFDLLGLPIMAIIRTYAGLPDKLDGLIIGELISLLALGAVVGYWQAKKTKVFYRDNQLCTVGGYPYIIGWIAMLAGRVIILLLFNFSALVSSFDAGQELLANEIARIAADWLIWSTITASSILYSLTLYRNHSGIRDFIHERLKKVGR
ncbi:hypothetical protein YDYSG_58310 [Paenibacillus tyrfis]|uniref:hypothetical protein n=1 Tax=Paenibacillus tyrfis TaxID=1501230 RepID=UPI0024939511|nr:hypothetical protein [Paenibacillus tyrfis]GLI09798.1 hypothetical protein YDYSG_58310 [Paenibacillus tyrfis]